MYRDGDSSAVKLSESSLEMEHYADFECYEEFNHHTYTVKAKNVKDGW